ncbi:nuclear transport factor 2 family protein [Micromonospora sp. NPDC023814]|uniref:nuclear transport factor 2 family protein n=1 Tax=Micromonospora sp. NPDC023814 TaxID=3154596 RepID=UPI0033DAF3CE
MTAVPTASTAGGYDDIAERFFAAVGRGDLAAVTDLYADDVEVWHNYDEVDQTREQSLRTLGWIHAKLGPLRYVDVRRTLLPDGFWQQHVAEITGDGATTRIPAALRVFCRAGKIVRIEEYLDPAPFTALVAARATT